MANNELRDADRFQVNKPISLDIELVIGIDQNGGEVVIPAKMCDISRTGCKLNSNVGQLQQTPEVVIVRIQSPTGRGTLEVAGVVCWARQTRVGQISFGLRFRRPLPDMIMQSLVDDGLVCRRGADRHPFRLAVDVRQQVNATSLKGTIVDISDTGVQLAIDQPIQTGQRLLFRTSVGGQCMVRSHWSASSTDEDGNQQPYLLGCAFVSKEGRKTLEAAAVPSSAALADTVDSVTLPKTIDDSEAATPATLPMPINPGLTPPSGSSTN
ncbi:MAG: PilZ domain-containing protein [Planctomycetota bacterium]